MSKRFVSTTALSLALVFVLSIGVSAAPGSQGEIGDLLDKVTTMTAAGRDAAAKASDSEAAAPAAQTSSAAPAPAEQSMGSAPGIVTGGTINVRSGPGTDYSKVTMLSTGKKVTQANLLLRQMLDTPNTLNILIPNQHIGAYRVGFMGEWLTREYLARRNGTVRMKHLVKARCPLFGYSLDEMKIDGQYVRRTFLRPELQSKLGYEGYDAGVKILTDFMKNQLMEFITDELDPIGRQIINLCLHDAPLEEYLAITPMNIK